MTKKLLEYLRELDIIIDDYVGDDAHNLCYDIREKIKTELRSITINIEFGDEVWLKELHEVLETWANE